MKSIIIIILCFVGLKAFCQTSELVVQEKASDWIKVTSTPGVTNTTSTRQRTSTKMKRKVTSKKPSVPKQDTQDEFEKTNNQVNRFKKSKKG